MMCGLAGAFLFRFGVPMGGGSGGFVADLGGIMNRLFVDWTGLYWTVYSSMMGLVWLSLGLISIMMIYCPIMLCYLCYGCFRYRATCTSISGFKIQRSS